MKNLSIGSKLALGLGVLVVTTLTVCVVGWYALSRLGGSVEHVLTDAWDTADGVMEAVIGTQREMLLLDELMQADSSEEIASRLKLVRERTHAIMLRLDAAGLLDVETRRLLRGMHATYDERLERLVSAHDENAARLSAFRAHTSRFHSLLATMEEVGDFNVEAAVAELDREGNAGALLEKWTAADGSMHVLIGFFRQLYFLNRFFSGETGDDVRSGIAQGIAFQENAAERILQSGQFDGFSLGEYREKSLGTAYEESWGEHVRLLREVMRTSEALGGAVRDYRSGAAELLHVLDRVEALGDAAVEEAREPTIGLMGRIELVFLACMLAAALFALWLGRYVHQHVIRPVVRLTEAAARIGAGDYGQRINADRGDEIGILAAAFNGMTAHVRDLVARLRERVEMYDLVADNVSDVIWVTDREQRFTFASPSLTRLLGYAPDKVRGMRLADLLPPETAAMVAELGRGTVTDAGACGRGVIVEHEMLHASGEMVWVECQLTPLCDAGGAYAGISGVTRDIAERKAVQRERDLLYEAITQAEEGILIAEGSSRALYANPSFTALMGRGKDEALAMARAAQDSGEDIFRYLRAGLESPRGFKATVEVARDKRKAVLMLTVVPVRIGEEDSDPRLVLLRDVTRERRLDSELRQAQKMQAVGTLASGIAHDFNNLLVPILMNAELLEMNPELGDPVRARLSDICTAANRAKELVRQILVFTRSGEAKLEPVQLGELVEEAAKLCGASLSPGIRVELGIKVRGGIMGNRTQLLQLLMNLCANAKAAMRGGEGHLRVDLDEIADEDGSWVRLRVCDTGEGIAREHLSRVFDPFFTTRQLGGGTGLGLAIAHKVVEGHGGRITVSSEVGKGTCFQVLLPARTASAAWPADAGEPEGLLAARPPFSLPVGRFSGRALVVDNEPSNIAAYESMLSLLGFEAEPFADARAALEAFNRDPDAFDLLLTDLRLPGMNGTELIGKVRTIRAELPVIPLTGYSDAGTEQCLADFGISPVLAKPFDIATLARAIESVIPTKHGD